MNLSEIIIIIIGLTFFEIISGVDNAVVNADILNTMPPKWRRWFLVYGIIFAVFVIRGLLPLLIVYFSTPGLGLIDSFTATFSSRNEVKEIIERQTPILLSGGGVFLVFLFLHWFFLETKKYAFFLERHIHKHYYFWFYALASVVLLATVWISLRINPLIALGATVGSTGFFIVNGFKQNAEEKERRLSHGKLSYLSKILYLELIDTTFSIDGVLGAFAFTVSVPLILIGNGLGAWVVRYLTIHGTHIVQKYAFLKNGAMYSIGLLGLIMLLESFGRHIASWMPPLTTFLVVGFFFYLSHRELKTKPTLRI